MKIDTLKDLEAMLKVCRKHGVTSISVDGMQMLISEQSEPSKPGSAPDKIDVGPQLSDEELMLWSSEPRLS